MASILDQTEIRPYLLTILFYLLVLWILFCHAFPIYQTRNRGLTYNRLKKYVLWVLKAWIIATLGYLLLCLLFTFHVISAPNSRFNQILANVTECAYRFRLNNCDNTGWICSLLQKECFALAMCISQPKSLIVTHEILLEWTYQFSSSSYWFIALVSLYILLCARFPNEVVTKAPHQPSPQQTPPPRHNDESAVMPTLQRTRSHRGDSFPRTPPQNHGPPLMAPSPGGLRPRSPSPASGVGPRIASEAIHDQGAQHAQDVLEQNLPQPLLLGEHQGHQNANADGTILPGAARGLLRQLAPQQENAEDILPHDPEQRLAQVMRALNIDYGAREDQVENPGTLNDIPSPIEENHEVQPAAELEQPPVPLTIVQRLQRHRLMLLPYDEEHHFPHGALTPGVDGREPEHHLVDESNARFRVRRGGAILEPEEVLQILAGPLPEHRRIEEPPQVVLEPQRAFFRSDVARRHLLVQRNLYPAPLASFTGSGMHLPRGDLRISPQPELNFPRAMIDQDGVGFIVLDEMDYAVLPADVMTIQNRLSHAQQLAANPPDPNSFYARNDLVTIMRGERGGHGILQWPQGHLVQSDESEVVVVDEAGRRLYVLRVADLLQPTRFDPVTRRLVLGEGPLSSHVVLSEQAEFLRGERQAQVAQLNAEQNQRVVPLHIASHISLTQVASRMRFQLLIMEAPPGPDNFLTHEGLLTVADYAGGAGNLQWPQGALDEGEDYESEVVDEAGQSFHVFRRADFFHPFFTSMDPATRDLAPNPLPLTSDEVLRLQADDLQVEPNAELNILPGDESTVVDGNLAPDVIQNAAPQDLAADANADDDGQEAPESPNSEDEELALHNEV